VSVHNGIYVCHAYTARRHCQKPAAGDLEANAARDQVMVARADHNRWVDDHCRQPLLDRLLNLAFGATLAVRLCERRAQGIEGCLFVSYRTLRRNSDRADGGGVNHPLHSRAQTCIHHDPGALHVHLIYLLTRGTPVGREAGNVEHEIAAFHCTLNRVGIQYVADPVFHRQARQHNQAGVAAVQYPDRITALDQRSDQL
jgi:hypothetical protein